MVTILSFNIHWNYKLNWASICQGFIKIDDFIPILSIFEIDCSHLQLEGPKIPKIATKFANEKLHQLFTLNLSKHDIAFQLLSYCMSELGFICKFPFFTLLKNDLFTYLKQIIHCSNFTAHYKKLIF